MKIFSFIAEPHSKMIQAISIILDTIYLVGLFQIFVQFH